MSDTPTDPGRTPPGQEPPADAGAGDPIEEAPLGQRLYDRPFLLLVAGLVIMLVFFTFWGLWEINSLPRAPLP